MNPELSASVFSDHEIQIRPLTPDTWEAFTRLFGEKGACGNCWCMYYRLPNTDFRAGKQDNGNREAMRSLVGAGKPAGLIAFYEGQPVGWCAFAPREDFGRLARSRVHKPIDNEAVWSIPCFFIDKKFRRKGLSVALLKGVIAYARQQNIRVLEAYPTIPTQEELPDSFAWIGLYKSFERAGFQIVDTTSRHRPMVRYYLDNASFGR